jgi:hypothetical protein
MHLPQPLKSLTKLILTLDALQWLQVWTLLTMLVGTIIMVTLGLVWHERKDVMVLIVVLCWMFCLALVWGEAK